MAGAKHENLDSRLNQLRGALLGLHKIMLESERAAYEQVHGPISGPNELLGLAMNHAWFDWLHRLSQMIVRIDEITDSDEFDADTASTFLDEARQTFCPTGEDDDFMVRYKAILKREPGAVLAHAEVQRALFS